ncbi:RNA polymerase sigma factor [Chryseobacterium taklimakanense]|uniref:RNA polymerase sigma factor n=1 Tax=Chryseobacterium taklimakanense TaxID=536441 RepID=A0A3G8WFV0_9FLAO|nr:RNA polymerase sigma factor [Chryseobacterium taklimakanense]AZI20040.1 RNA polymerase sigma factor [Chryseobacterium taklimakanense]
MSLEKEFLEKIEKHKGVVFKISKMYMDDYDDQKDLFQEITFQAWKAFPNFRGESEFSTWLYRIALNTAIIFLKYEKKRSFLQNTETENLKVETEEYSGEKDIKIEKLYNAIHQLNAIDKALIFYYLENYSGKEMAEQLGISEVNCRVKLNRAKEN